MTETLINKWDSRYATGDSAMQKPAWVLQEFAHLLPKQGRALDLACGLGGNAILLARQGLDVSAWDISTVAMEKLRTFAGEHALSITAEPHDVEREPPLSETFDVIVVSHFLDRSLLPWLQEALRPGGLLYYQTFTTDRLPDSPGPSNPDYLLTPNELLYAFNGLELLAYREEGRVGDLNAGIRNVAALVAHRPVL